MSSPSGQQAERAAVLQPARAVVLQAANQRFPSFPRPPPSSRGPGYVQSTQRSATISPSPVHVHEMSCPSHSPRASLPRSSHSPRASLPRSSHSPRASLPRSSSPSWDRAASESSCESLTSRSHDDYKGPRFAILYWGIDKPTGKGWDLGTNTSNSTFFPRICPSCESVKETFKGRAENAQVTLRMCAAEGPGFKRYVKHFMMATPQASVEFHLRKYHECNKAKKKAVLSETVVLGGMLTGLHRKESKDASGITIRNAVGCYKGLIKRRARRYRRQAHNLGGKFIAIVLDEDGHNADPFQMVRHLTLHSKGEPDTGCGDIKRVLIILGGPGGIGPEIRSEFKRILEPYLDTSVVRLKLPGGTLHSYFALARLFGFHEEKLLLPWVRMLINGLDSEVETADPDLERSISQQQVAEDEDTSPAVEAQQSERRLNEEEVKHAEFRAKMAEEQAACLQNEVHLLEMKLAAVEKMPTQTTQECQVQPAQRTQTCQVQEGELERAGASVSVLQRKLESSRHQNEGSEAKKQRSKDAEGHKNELEDKHPDRDKQELEENQKKDRDGLKDSKEEEEKERRQRETEKAKAKANAKEKEKEKQNKKGTKKAENNSEQKGESEEDEIPAEFLGDGSVAAQLVRDKLWRKDKKKDASANIARVLERSNQAVNRKRAKGLVNRTWKEFDWTRFPQSVGVKCKSGKHNLVLADRLEVEFRCEYQVPLKCDECEVRLQASHWVCTTCCKHYCFECRPKAPWRCWQSNHDLHESDAMGGNRFCVDCKTAVAVRFCHSCDYRVCSACSMHVQDTGDFCEDAEELTDFRKPEETQHFTEIHLTCHPDAYLVQQPDVGKRGTETDTCIACGFVMGHGKRNYCSRCGSPWGHQNQEQLEKEEKVSKASRLAVCADRLRLRWTRGPAKADRADSAKTGLTHKPTPRVKAVAVGKRRYEEADCSKRADMLIPSESADVTKKSGSCKRSKKTNSEV